MGELTLELPKPLLPVNGVPLVYYALFLARKLGASEIAMNLHYNSEKILEELKDFEANIRFSLEVPEILGTAGGMKTAIGDYWEEDEYFICNQSGLYFFAKKRI